MIHIFKNMSIRNKLIYIIMLTSSIVLLMTSIGFIISDFFSFKKTMIMDLVSLADVIGSNSRAAITFNDQKTAEETLSALANKPNIISAHIYKNDRSEFAKFINRKVSKTSADHPDEGYTYVLKDQKNANLFSINHLDVYRRIILDNEVIGIVHIRSNLREMYSRLAWNSIIAVIFLIVSLFIAYVLALRLQRVITKPVLNLTEKMNSISTEKNYSVRAVKESNDEVGVLIDGFNDMLEQIQKRDDNINISSTKLQEMVTQSREKQEYLEKNAKSINEVMKEISKWNLNVKIEKERDDEIGSIIDSINLTLNNLRHIVMQIRTAAENTASNADEISMSAVQISEGASLQSSSTEDTSSTMVEMAQQIDSINESTQALASNVHETSSSIQEMGASITQMSTNAENLRNAAEETNSIIKQMTSSINSVAEKIKAVEVVSRDASQVANEGGKELFNVINGIGASSKDIVKIIEIIDEIVDQTKLLSLNAAIEAARAGDSGKGFTVVADEIKRLADRSAHSIQEISSYVKTVLKNADQAVDLTQKVLQKMIDSVNKTSDLVNDVFVATQGQTIRASQVIDASINMQNTTTEIVTAIREMENSSKLIMRAVEDMNHMTQDVANSTMEQKRGGDMVVKAVEQIAQIAQKNVSATEQLFKATQNLATEADNMLKLVALFIV